MFLLWPATFATVIILPLITRVLSSSGMESQNVRRKALPPGDPRVGDPPGVIPPLDDENGAPPSGDPEKARIRLVIAITGTAMVPVVVVGILVAVPLGASPFVAAPLVVLVGGLVAKIASYYFPSNE